MKEKQNRPWNTVDVCREVRKAASKLTAEEKEKLLNEALALINDGARKNKLKSLMRETYKARERVSKMSDEEKKVLEDRARKILNKAAKHRTKSK